MTFPIYGKIKNVPNHQSVKVVCSSGEKWNCSDRGIEAGHVPEKSHWLVDENISQRLLPVKTKLYW
jgi:hypothetical protein